MLPFSKYKELIKKQLINTIHKDLKLTELKHNEDLVTYVKPSMSYLIIKNDSNMMKFFIRVMY